MSAAIEDGTTLYSVVLYGDNGEDPTYRVKPLATFETSKEALKAAREAVRIQNANERGGLLWSAEVEEGHREGVNDPDYGYISGVHWESHENGKRWWVVQFEGGRVEVDER